MSGCTGDYAGMSNDKTGENPVRRKPKVSSARQIRRGLAGPLVKAERRRRWVAGEYSCAVYLDRWRDGIQKVSDTDRNVRRMIEMGGLANPPPEFKRNAGLLILKEVTGRMSKKIF